MSWHCWKPTGWKRSTESGTTSVYRTVFLFHGRPHMTLMPGQTVGFLTMSAVQCGMYMDSPRMPSTSLPYNFLQDHSYRISILTCKGRLLPSIGQGGPPDWLEGKNHPRFAPVFFPSKPCAITAKSKPGHIRNGNTGFCQAGHV